jgi:uncharacterized protein YidB (DUF937 family)
LGFLELLGTVGGKASKGGLTESIGGLLERGSTVGGLGGLLETLQKSGLGDVGASWVSKETNLPISADQLESVLGEEYVRAIAGKLGVPPEKAAAQLARYLPQVVDRLTPDGTVPSDEQLQAGLARLSSAS